MRMVWEASALSNIEMVKHEERRVGPEFRCSDGPAYAGTGTFGLLNGLNDFLDSPKLERHICLFGLFWLF